jgi:hypothetical protein
MDRKMKYDVEEFKTLEEVINSDWYLSMPGIIQRAVLLLPPIRYYKIKSMGQQCWLVSYFEPFESDRAEDVQVRVQKTGRREVAGITTCTEDKYNQSGVFGLKLTDLEPW